MPETKRLFAAINIQPNETFADLYHNLRQILGIHIIKWVDLSHIHITLKFFGETPETEIPAIIEALQSSVAGIQPFELNIRRTGIFGSKYNPRVIWFGIDPNTMFLKLNEHVNAALEEVGFISDRQNFVPHLTVGRVKEIRDKNHFQEVLAAFKDFNFQQSMVKEFHLFESILQREGPQYQVIETFAF
ncbi:MAG: RNA 2',3'-cyclic phosphodiesterase [Lentimicrobiaceae bacterium]|nr:RNA 2',3'-cyclic phosphodiesterase [Lentimicrobiaceae bacterium]